MVEQIFLIASVTFLVMISPGPDMVLVLRNTVVGGRHAGLQTSIGILAGNLIHITCCVLGLGLLISESIVAFSMLKYAGAAYLIYLGVMSFRAGAHTPDINVIERRRTTQSPFVQGFVNNLLNPKGTLFYLGIFTVVIRPETSAGAMVLLICIMMFVSASFWLVFVHTLDRPAIRGLVERSQQTVQPICGVLLIALGLRLASTER